MTKSKNRTNGLPNNAPTKDEKEKSYSWLPDQEWFSLKQACSLKNLNYKTSCNKKHLQPRAGQEDGRVGGVKMWRRETIIEWLNMDDARIVQDENNE